MKNALGNHGQRARAAVVETRALTWPVQGFIATELIAAVVLAGLAAMWLWDRAAAFDPASAPPWPALAACPLGGALAHLVRRAHLVVTARRWHGVLIRRLDERLAHDDQDSDHTSSASAVSETGEDSE